MTKVQQLERAWDARLNISTGGRDALKADESHHAYEPTPYVCLERLAKEKLITRETTVLDYGSGKGRAAIFLAAVTGCRALGVDFDPWMVKKAEANVESWISGGRHFKGRVPVEGQVCFTCMEAEEYNPDAADCFFFFNPFPEAVFRRVLLRICKSLREHSRSGFLFLYFPAQGFLSCMADMPEFSFFKELSCTDLFPDGSRQERIMIYSFGNQGSTE